MPGTARNASEIEWALRDAGRSLSSAQAALSDVLSDLKHEEPEHTPAIRDVLGTLNLLKASLVQTEISWHGYAVARRNAL